MRGKLANVGKAVKGYNPMPQGRGMAMLMGRGFCGRCCWKLC
jgi:hypothetical protein